MGSIPLPALHVEQPQQNNALAMLAQALQLKNAQQQNQMGQVQLQQAQRQAQDQKILGDLMVKHQGNLDKVAADAPGAGVSPNGVLGLQQHIVDVKQKSATLNADQLKNIATQNDNAAGLIQPVLDAKTPEAKDTAYAQAIQAAAQNPQMYGITDPSQLPQQRPPDDQLKVQLAVHMGQKEQVAQAMKEREVAAQELTAQGRADQGKAALAKNAPMAPQEIGFRNQQFQDRFQVLNPGQKLPQEFALPQNATRQDYEDRNTALQQLENASATRAQQKLAQSTQAGNRSDARSDKSYQFNSAQLEKIAAPVDQSIARIGRLQESIAQRTPQADSLIAPELLSVMAGGSGSGLRMNEAEISRVLGGRTAWQTLQANLNKWSGDPTHVQIPDAQRQQISDLVNAVDAKLKQKQQALDDARQGLINSNDPNEHRAIVVKARSAMTQIDQGQNSQPQSSGGHIIEMGGKKYQYKGSGDTADINNYKPL